MKSHINRIVSALLIIVFFFVAASFYSKFGNPLSFSVNSNITNQTDIFTVTGEGKFYVQSDIAYINVGIHKTASTVKQAQSQINEVVTQVISGLKELDISSKDIKTSSYSINPTYDWSSSTQRITGYTADTQLKIKISDIDKINDVIDSATASGANQINNITFDIEDREAAEESARKDAVAQANQKAKAAAEAAGFKLGKIISYSESSNNSLIRPANITLQKSMADDMSGGGTNIQSGSEEIEIIVNLSYQIN